MILRIHIAGGIKVAIGKRTSMSPSKATGILTNSSTRLLGLLLVLVSAGIFSSAGLFVKSVTAEAWVIIFWRGLFAVLFTTGYIIYRGTLRKEFTQMGKPGVAAALIGALGTIAFIASFKFTSIANVSLIYAASPFIAAAIMWFWMREKPTLTIIIASLVAFSGVLVIVVGSIGNINLKGDLLALWMTIAMSIYFCIYRRFPNTPAAGPAVLMSFLLVIVASLFANPFHAPLDEILIMAAFGLVFSAASVTLAEGAKRLPAAETALLSALETPLAPVWAWLMFSEIPAVLTLVGGVIVLLAVYGSQLFN
jgi:drug/metabolite transporter (DMT)-like permease